MKIKNNICLGALVKVNVFNEEYFNWFRKSSESKQLSENSSWICLKSVGA
jgi:hypothetical protein